MNPIDILNYELAHQHDHENFTKGITFAVPVVTVFWVAVFWIAWSWL